jgi:hypothetical protein
VILWAVRSGFARSNYFIVGWVELRETHHSLTNKSSGSREARLTLRICQAPIFNRSFILKRFL